MAGRSIVTGGRIKSSGDLKRISLPDPDDPELYEPIRKFIEKYRPTHRAIFCGLNLGSDPVMLGMGIETFSMALYDNYSLVEELLDIYTDWYARVVRQLCQLDLDFLWTTDDLAFKSSTFISPQFFKKLFMPYYRKVAEQFTKPWVFHSDGAIKPLLDDLVDLGMSGLHPIEPGALDLNEVKQKYGKNLCLLGHISVDTLSRGTPQEIDHLVKDAIHIAGPGGGYIIGSSNCITEYCKPENVMALKKAIRRYGNYPL